MPKDLEKPNTNATKPVHPRIAVIFDFDDTLASDSFGGLIKFLGLEEELFRQQFYDPLKKAGWDHEIARFHCIIEESKRRDQKITRETLEQFGKEIQMFEGVTESFGRLRNHVQSLDPEIELELYLLSGGFVEVISSTCIASHFKDIWGCEFHFAENGEVQFAKRTISHAEKPRYLMRIASGQEQVDANGEAFAYQDMSKNQLRLPLDQMIYVGDGTSDVPCFSLLNSQGGIAIGVYKGDLKNWNQKVNVTASQRLSNLVSADYRQDSNLMRSLTLALEILCKKISLRQLSAEG